MASPKHIAQQIRFHLEQLSAQNAHHRFEHLCRQYARTRICSNILPATGPVSAGGDQGRDFETFRSHLAQSPLGSQAFVGNIADGPLAFACTLQRKPLDTKILSDVETIMASGTKVAGIHFFCSEDLPVAKRHALQKSVLDSHSVHLEIHDGQALSEHLADKDIFWIAIEYLDVPGEIHPEMESTLDGSYELSKGEFKDATIDCNSYRQFYELKRLLREARSDENLQSDIPYWLGLIQKYTTPDGHPSLAQRSRYEIVLTSIFSLKSLEGREDHVRSYFATFVKAEDSRDFDDAVLLLNCCTTATRLGLGDLTHTELKSWYEVTISRVDTELTKEILPSTRACLLENRGRLAFYEITESSITTTVDECLTWWQKVIDLLPNAPLFPLGRFSDSLTILCNMPESHSQLAVISEAVDVAITARYGGFEAAEKCRDRALAHYHQGRILEAFDEIHRAKINWFAKETLDGTVLTLLILGQWYTDNGLTLAGKYYSLAAAYISVSSDEPRVKELAWKGYLGAARCDHNLGAWAGFFDYARMTLHANCTFNFSPGDEACDPEIVHLLDRARSMVTISYKISDSLGKWARSRLNEIFPPDDIDGELESARNKIQEMNREEFLESLQANLSGVPVDDVCNNRTMSWAALGVTWTCDWFNDYHTTIAAEQFLASLQITQLELTRFELILPSTKVFLEFELGHVQQPSITPEISGPGLKLKVIWPGGEQPNDLDQMNQWCVYAAFNIMIHLSLLGEDDLWKVIEEAFRNGAHGKTLVGRPYHQIYSETVDEESFINGRKIMATEQERLFTYEPRENPALRGPQGKGPGYSKEESTSLIAHRYDFIRQHLPHTLDSLVKSPSFRQLALELRGENWKDWHILTSVLTLVIDYRCQQHFDHPPTPSESLSFFKLHMNEPEKEDDIEVPVEMFSKENLEKFRQLNIPSVMKNWGLEFRHPVIPQEAYEEILVRKYGYWDDDVDHADFFGAGD